MHSTPVAPPQYEPRPDSTGAVVQPLVYWAQVLVVVPQVIVFQLGHCVQVHTGQPLVAQLPEPSDQVPAVALSFLSAVHTQVRCRLQVSLALVQTPVVVLQE